MSKLDRHTLFIDDDSSALHQMVSGPVAVHQVQQLNRTGELSTAKSVQETARGEDDMSPGVASRNSPRNRFPVKRTSGEVLVPVVSGSPWKHYEKRYRLKFWCSFAVVTRESRDKEPYMIRTISGSNADGKIQNIRQMFHPNIVRNVELYASTDESYSLISEMMATSLLHVCRSPMYPSESQLSSIVYQILSASEYLLRFDLVHEDISCACVLVNFAGSVKISDIEHCKRNGSSSKFFDSFSKMIMMLMDKEKSSSSSVGLTHPNRWSSEAFELFTKMISQPTMEDLSRHPFLGKRNQKELEWLVLFVLITAHHSRE
ncbi:hypothetical protein B0T10DRAFT_531106 [Thelonectria olida]|uniref:Protein kinase domain-containing protein n=1 Tax=Thelonectria olida TaxID=1576542 RepID=A0A9P8W159_9HYPO|nr:hypothetical protein B0T10DRAFT_531106 [Thelonectria olida]